MEIFWISLTSTNKEKVLSEIIKLEKKSIVFTPNPEILLKIRKDSEFKETLNKADYLLPDGIGIFIAYQILSDKQKSKIVQTLKLPYYIFNLFFRRKYLYKIYWERICGSDLTKSLLEEFNKRKEKITVIDLHTPWDENKKKFQENFKNKMQEYFPNLKIDYHIYDESKKEEIIEEIKKSDSKALFSTLWMKKQEQSVIEIMKKCENIKLWLWIWSSFDYFTGFQKRAPKFMRMMWIEWLYRLFTWPQKLKRLKRLYNAIFVFTWKIIKECN